MPEPKIRTIAVCVEETLYSALQRRMSKYNISASGYLRKLLLHDLIGTRELNQEDLIRMVGGAGDLPGQLPSM